MVPWLLPQVGAEPQTGEGFRLGSSMMRRRTEPRRDPGPQPLRPGCLAWKLWVRLCGWAGGLLGMWPLGGSPSSLGCCQLLGQMGGPLSFFIFPREVSEGPGVALLQCLARLVPGGPMDRPSIRHTGRQAASHVHATSQSETTRARNLSLPCLFPFMPSALSCCPQLGT